MSQFASVSQYKTPALGAAAIGIGLCVLGFFIDPQQFYVSYLEGFMWISAIPFGAFALLMVHTLSGGNWGWTIRPFLVSAAKTLPFVALLFIPLIFGMKDLYPWMDHEFVHHNPALVAKQAYLNEKFWLVRAAFYWVSWILLSRLLIGRLVSGPSKLLDLPRLHAAQRVAAGGALFFMLTVSFAAIDWVMSIEPEWFSSVFGALIVTGQAMSAFAFATWCLISTNKANPNPWMQEKNVHDLGKFLFMTVMLWGYLSLSQYLIIYGGNLPEETYWYHERSIGGWCVVSAIIVLFQFVVPFCWLLSKHIKRNIRVLPYVIALLFAVRWLEQLWLVKPGLMAGKFPVHWLDFAAPLAVGGAWCFVYFGILSKAEGVEAPPPGHGHHGHGHHPVDKGPKGQPKEHKEAPQDQPQNQPQDKPHGKPVIKPA